MHDSGRQSLVRFERCLHDPKCLLKRRLCNTVKHHLAPFPHVGSNVWLVVGANTPVVLPEFAGPFACGSWQINASSPKWLVPAVSGWREVERPERVVEGVHRQRNDATLHEHALNPEAEMNLRKPDRMSICLDRFDRINAFTARVMY